jgi:hypothetical protein
MSTDKIIIKHALLITLLIGSFFFFCTLFGLEGNPYLRFLNIGFVIFGIYLAIKESIYKNGESKYLINLGIGIRTSAFAVILSVIGVIIYIQFIDPDFINIMKNSFLIGSNLSIPKIAITLVIEGMASSIIGSFIMMQYYKNHDKKISKI